jgi:hypothetical protein
VVKGGKSLRLCPVRHRSVYCDGACVVVDGAGAVKMCLMYVDALDVALNGN